jgi:MGT family glycosyltransferase
MLTVARHLRDSGYRITFNTGEVFRQQVESANLRFVPLTGVANWDYRRIEDLFPERKNYEPGPALLSHDFKRAFADAIPDQYRVVQQIMHESTVDLILTDVSFMGTIPTLLGPREARPPIISFGIAPLMLSSIDTSPYSLPDSSPEGRKRNQRENRQFQTELSSVDDYINRILSDYDAAPLPGFFLDCFYTVPDLFLQLSAEAFEYPRSDMPASIQFVGPMLPKAKKSADFRPPVWWKELDAPKPVVLVTQGTIANMDLSQLIEPTLTGLANEDVMIVVAHGGGDMKTIPVPSNARVESFVPFTDILPKVDVFVTNGGYGGVSQALSMGVPIVIAGISEDKVFVAARVGWSGAGINLQTDRPHPDQVRTAVRTVLADSQYRHKARELQKNFAQYDALRQISQIVESQLADSGRFSPETPSVHRSVDTGR